MGLEYSERRLLLSRSSLVLSCRILNVASARSPASGLRFPPTQIRIARRSHGPNRSVLSPPAPVSAVAEPKREVRANILNRRQAVAAPPGTNTEQRRSLPNEPSPVSAEVCATQGRPFHSLRRKSVLESGKIRFDGTKRHSLYLGIQDYAPAPSGRRTRHRGSVKVRFDEVHPAEFRPGEVHPDEVHVVEFRPTGFRPGEIHPDEVHVVEFRPAEVRPGEVRPAEVHPGEAESAVGTRFGCFRDWLLSPGGQVVEASSPACV